MNPADRSPVVPAPGRWLTPLVVIPAFVLIAGCKGDPAKTDTSKTDFSSVVRNPSIVKLLRLLHDFDAGRKEKVFYADIYPIGDTKVATFSLPAGHLNEQDLAAWSQEITKQAKASGKAMTVQKVTAISFQVDEAGQRFDLAYVAINGALTQPDGTEQPFGSNERLKLHGDVWNAERSAAFAEQVYEALSAYVSAVREEEDRQKKKKKAENAGSKVPPPRIRKSP